VKDFSSSAPNRAAYQIAAADSFVVPPACRLRLMLVIARAPTHAHVAVTDHPGGMDRAITREAFEWNHAPPGPGGVALGGPAAFFQSPPSGPPPVSVGPL